MKVNEKLWCQFIKGKKVIVTETQEEFNKLMEIIDERTNFKWGSGDPIKSCPDYWDVFKENTTIERWPNISDCIYYGKKNIYKDKIDFKDLFSKEEEKMQVLDDVEKKYIGNIIAPKPIYNSVKFIIKERSLFSPLDKERIEIIYKDGSSLHTCLPDFAAGTMYRGMKIDKRYTLKALGL
jgi:hypothetical protein